MFHSYRLGVFIQQYSKTILRAIPTRRLLKNRRYNQCYNQPIIASIPVGMALLGDRCWAILIARRLNCGQSILNQIDYMKATELHSIRIAGQSVAQQQRDLVGMAL